MLYSGRSADGSHLLVCKTAVSTNMHVILDADGDIQIFFPAVKTTTREFRLLTPFSQLH